MFAQLLDRIDALNKSTEPPWMLTITGAPHCGFFCRGLANRGTSISARGRTIDEACRGAVYDLDRLIDTSFPDSLGFM